VPPSASSKRPTRRSIAPVNAPLTWPKSSLSTSPAEMALQLTLTSARSRRALRAWMARAISSLPVPVIAGDEHGRVRGCDLLDLAKERQERWAIADQLGEVVLTVDFLLEVDALALVAILECCDLLVSPHVLDGQRDLVRDLTEEHGIRLRVLAGIDAGDGQDADTPAVYDQGNDDVGPHTISIGLLVG